MSVQTKQLSTDGVGVLPTGEEYRKLAKGRQRTGTIWAVIFRFRR
ncbi:MAG: hypothetical protein R2873_17370 [Caldilineaceae bacterium]